MFLSTLTLVSLFSLVLSIPAPAGDSAIAAIPGVNITNLAISGTPSAVKDSYIVVYKNSASDADIDKYEEKVTKKIGKGLKNKWRVRPTAEGQKGFKASHVQTDRRGLQAIANDPLVSFVEIDSIVSVAPIIGNNTKAPSTSEEGKSGAESLLNRVSATWGLGRISHRLTGFFNYIYDDTACAGTRIYIVDSGVRITHEEFRGPVLGGPGRAVYGANFISGSPNTDQYGHGTHCAGTAAGWYVGVCRKATIVSVKVLNAQGSGATSGVIAGLQWAAKDAIAKGYRYKSVISASVGGPYSAAQNAAVQAIINQGIPVVVAAGNEDQNAYNRSPASAVNAITVGATDYYDERAYFSNWGLALDVFAPGYDILSAYHLSDSYYYYMSGTSQATPHVAGIAAYLIAKEKIKGGITIRNRIVALSTKNKVIDAKGSYNRLAYNGSGR